MNKTIAFLLAGGNGRRFGALTLSRPKPLVPFALKNRLIDFPLSNATNSGVKRLGILVQSNQKSIIDYIGRGESWGFENNNDELMILSSGDCTGHNYKYRGTADAVRQNLNIIKNDPYIDTVLILAADQVYKMDYNELINFHRLYGADVTVATTNVSIRETHRFGIVGQDNFNRIVNWQEKPAGSTNTLASMGIYVFSRKFLIHALESTGGDDLGHHIMPFACQTARVCGFKFSNYWRDVGTPDTYWQSTMHLLDPGKGLNLDRWHIRSNYSFNNHNQRIKRKYVASCASVHNSMLSENSVIKGRIINSVVFPGARIAKNAYVRNSIIMSNCNIESNSRIENTILCDNVNIGKGSLVGCTRSSSHFEMEEVSENGLVVIGENISLKPGECIHKNSMLSSQEQYEENSQIYKEDEQFFTRKELINQLILN
ncbi:NTP transferase domain-containing protein [candidate division KSB1 bacterium]|nr:NTP transferase domain-containing protein [candidate division KSB1 bacterium]